MELLTGEKVKALRYLSIHVLDGEDNAPSVEHLMKDSTEDKEKYRREWHDWYRRTYGDADNATADEVYNATVLYVAAAERLAYEQGMKAGAQLIAELMDIRTKAV